MPLLPLTDDDLREELGEQAEKMVAVAEVGALRLRGAIKDALFGKGDKPKFDAGLLGLAMRRLWDECEGHFYRTMGRLGEVLRENEPYSEPNQALLESWLIEVSPPSQNHLQRIDRQRKPAPGKPRAAGPRRPFCWTAAWESGRKFCARRWACPTSRR